MKRTFGFAAILAGLCLSIPAVHAQSADSDAGFFVNAKAGHAYYSGDKTAGSNAYGVDLGYRWALGAGNALGIEAGYIKPQSVDYNSYGWHEGLSTEAYTLGASYRWSFGGNNNDGHWYVAARGGLMHWQQKDQETYPGAYSVTYNDSGSGSYAGAGIGYDFNRNVGVGLHYDYYLAKLYHDNNGYYHANGFSALMAQLEVRF